MVWRTKHRVWCNCRPWQVCIYTWREGEEHKSQQGSSQRRASNSVHKPWLSPCMWHMTGSLVKAKRTEPKFELLSTIHCQGDRLLHLSSAKKIDCLREKGKKILEKQQNPDFLHDIIHNAKLFSVHRNRKIWPILKIKSSEANFKITKMLELAGKDFISDIVIV